MALQWDGAKGLPPAAGGPALELRSVAPSLLASGLPFSKIANNDLADRMPNAGWIAVAMHRQ